MAQHDKVVDFLTQSSPLLSETAALLSETSLPVVGLPGSDPEREVGATTVKIRSDQIALADLVTNHAPVISGAAPDLALAAPDVTVAAAA
jgi:hypothetical protein